MVLWFIRLLFVLTLLAAASKFVEGLETSDETALSLNRTWFILAAFGLGLIGVGFDLLLTKKSLRAIGGMFFGLIVGLLGAFALGLVVDLIHQTGLLRSVLGVAPSDQLVSTIKFVVGLICCFFAVSIILQTKDDFRFVIPYVEFSKQTKGARPLVLDTSVIIDGRIADICDTRMVDSPLVVPRFVLAELQRIADSADRLKRNRGRRGLDILNRLQSAAKIEIHIDDTTFDEVERCDGVDQMLVAYTQVRNGRLMTNDFNLNKIATLRGVEVININDLANALKPLFMPGEELSVRIIKPGEQQGQGVGYLEDGTMVVAEAAADRIGETLEITVTSVLQSSAGRMIFGRPVGAEPRVGPRRRPHRPASQTS